MHETFLLQVGSALKQADAGQVVLVDDSSSIGEVGPQDNADYKSDHAHDECEVSLFFLVLSLELLIAAKSSDGNGKQIAEHEDSHRSSCCNSLNA